MVRDDQYNTLKWKSFLKDCAFYYDKPTFDQEREMKSILQKKYDDLLPEGWRPPLDTRRSLLTWGCVQHNNFVIENRGEENVFDDCANFNMLLENYGPDYDRLKDKLGHMRGLFDD